MAKAACVGLVQKLSGEIQLCRRGFHATLEIDQWKGERIWIVGLSGEVLFDGDKWVASEREFLAEIAA